MGNNKRKMKVELVAKTIGIGKYSGLTSEEIVSAIARHGVIKEDNGKLVKYLMSNHHWSPLDMINFSFEIETSRAIGRQMLRHSSIKPQEHSQRYSSKVSFEDIELRKEDVINRQSSTEVFDPIIGLLGGKPETAGMRIKWLKEQINISYNLMIDAGVAKECARGILPECTTTILTFNGSLRSWLAFLNVRMDFHSQSEIISIAKLIGESLEEEMPNVFSSIEWRKGMFM